jgi:hypothetical protein
VLARRVPGASTHVRDAAAPAADLGGVLRLGELRDAGPLKLESTKYVPYPATLSCPESCTRVVATRLQIVFGCSY